jgi:hypothetical protein
MAAPAHPILAAMPAAADLFHPGLAGLQMTTAFQEIPMGQVTLALIFPPQKAPMFMRRVMAL